MYLADDPSPENHQYGYASKLKLMAAIEAKQLDVVLEGNAVEYTLTEASRYQADTKEVTNGLEISAFPMFQAAGFSEPVYLGVIANSPRISTVMQYIAYLTGPQPPAECEI